MTCACIRENGFNLQLSSNNCDVLVVEDFSRWVYSVKEDIPTQFKVTMKVLSTGRQVELDINTGCKNFFSSEDIFGSNIKCIPDGLYCFTTEVCGITFTITRAFLRNSEIEYLKIVSRYAGNLDTETRNFLTSTHILLESIEANAELGNYQLAKELFKRLDDSLKYFRCDNC